MIEVSENIKSYLSTLYGKDAADEYVEFIKREPTQYIRVNPLKADTKNLIQRLQKDFSIFTEEIKSIPNALKVKSGNQLLGKTVEHIIGQYYIQGLSSMIPPLILNPGPDDIVLDLCSAPGSKTTGLSEMMNNRGTLIANEIAFERVKTLVYNIDRMNLMNAGVMHYKGEMLSKIFSEHFDKILVDAPCSGLGIIQKKEEVSNWWSLERVARLGDLQLRLLIAAIKMVKVGGDIVYSTCTLTPEENEFVINKVLQKYPVEIEEINLPVKSREAFTKYNGETFHPSLSKARRIVPWEVDSDGFFIVKLKKTGETKSPDLLNMKSSGTRLLDYRHKEVKKLLETIREEFGIESSIFSNFKFLKKRNDIYFINSKWEENNLELFERVGTKFGVIDKDGEITLHTQAAQILQNYISKKIYLIESHDELKKYLEGGIIRKDISFKGQCVVKYRGYILGTAVVANGGIKSRFPRAKRTQEISFL
ncbi:MAG: NOL1/NOP2/sun family putative RNA methylase [Ignavibacteriaceae bacterium]